MPADPSSPSPGRDASHGPPRVHLAKPHPLGEARGLQRIAVGSIVGLAAGLNGLALPTALYVRASDSPGVLSLSPSALVQVTSLLALVGAILFAISLLLYRSGFKILRASDRRLWLASLLCGAGTVGVILLLLPILFAFIGSDTMANCVQGAPSKALACIGTSTPLVGGLATIGGWLLWAGGLGVVVGIFLTSVRYRQPSLMAGSALYALILLVLIGPLVGALGWLRLGVLAIPIMVLIAPIAVFYGNRRIAEAEERPEGQRAKFEPAPS